MIDETRKESLVKTACINCKNINFEVYPYHLAHEPNEAECYASPKMIEFDPIYGENHFIGGFSLCKDINNGYCNKFEGKIPEPPNPPKTIYKIEGVYNTEKINCNYCGNKSDFACGQCLPHYNYCYRFSFKKWLTYWLSNRYFRKE
jgi:hypothetical protein